MESQNPLQPHGSDNSAEPDLHTELLISRLGIRLEAERGPLHRQLFDQFRNLIFSLQLMPGELLPSTRELAAALKISRKTVSRVYDDLTSQGFIHSKTGIGTFVCRIPPEVASPVQKKSKLTVAACPLSTYGERLMHDSSWEPTHQGELPELHFGAPPADRLPVASWRKALLKVLRELDLAAIDYDTDPFGYYPLRRAIASYLGRARALRCQPEQLIVFSNALSHLRLLSRMLVDQGTPVAVENPGFPFARRIFGSLGADLIPIDVDDDGIKLDALRSIQSPKIVYVTPSHQDPTGVVLSLPRRQELLEWASKNHCLIVEDDYDCEFRYTGTRIPALAAMDKSESVIYLGDFWKTLFPIVNVGYVVLPVPLVDVFKKAQSLGWTKENTSLPMLDSLCLKEFIDEGSYENHIRRTREIYARRYRNLVTSLARCFGNTIQLGKDSGGMQVLLRTSLPHRDATIRNAAADAGLALIPTQTYYFGRRVEREFLLSFVIYDESRMTACVEAWARNLSFTS